jgi:glycogen operon protein
VEGETDDPGIQSLRARLKRNFLSTLLLSQGVPMLLAGDEMGRTQQGNNNAYCQDNEISWLNWDLQPEQQQLLVFVRQLTHLRKQHPVFHRQHFFQGRPIKGVGIKDIIWLNPNGQEMSEEEWRQSFARCLGIYLAGEALDERDERGQPILDDDFLLLLNAHDGEIPFLLPNYKADADWRVVLDTAETNAPNHHYTSGEQYKLKSRSLALLSHLALKP